MLHRRLRLKASYAPRFALLICLTFFSRFASRVYCFSMSRAYLFTSLIGMISISCFTNGTKLNSGLVESLYLTRVPVGLDVERVLVALTVFFAVIKALRFN